MKALVPLLTGSRDVRFEIVPGGHLGHADRSPGTHQHLAGDRRVGRRVALLGRRAPEGARAGDRPAYDQEGGREEEAGGQQEAARPASPETSQDEPAIGLNPSRRYGSAGSRALRR